MTSARLTIFIDNFKAGFIRMLILLRDGLKLFFTAPASWGIRGWTLFAIVPITAAAAYYFKWPIYEFFVGDKSGPLWTLVKFARRCGDFEPPLFFAIFLALAGCYTDNGKLTDAGVALLAAMGIAGIFTPLGQFIFAEARPYEGGVMHFLAMGGHGVSGHATSTSVVIFPLTYGLFRDSSRSVRAAVMAALIAWTLLVCWARLYEAKHFLWNVILGLAVGLYSGYIIWQVGKNSDV